MLITKAGQDVWWPEELRVANFPAHSLSWVRMTNASWRWT